MNKHVLKLLEATEKLGLMWDRVNENTIWISMPGYKTQDLYDLEEQLLILGCRYALESYVVQDFDRVSGRTTTYITEPKN